MLVAHRIRLDPNTLQKTYLARAAGAARFAYNWALNEWQKQYEACKTNPTLTSSVSQERTGRSLFAHE